MSNKKISSWLLILGGSAFWFCGYWLLGEDPGLVWLARVVATLLALGAAIELHDGLRYEAQTFFVYILGGLATLLLLAYLGLALLSSSDNPPLTWQDCGVCLLLLLYALAAGFRLGSKDEA